MLAPGSVTRSVCPVAAHPLLLSHGRERVRDRVADTRFGRTLAATLRNEIPNLSRRRPPEGVALPAEGAYSASTRDRRGTVVQAVFHTVAATYRSASVRSGRLGHSSRDSPLRPAATQADPLFQVARSRSTPWLLRAPEGGMIARPKPR